jgi:flagellar protein FlaI
VADISTGPGRWAVRPVVPQPRSVVELISTGTLDAELAATLWILIEGRVPLIVAADAPGTGSSTLLAALLDFIPPTVRVVDVAGATETFDWLPQASELGWQRRPGRSAASSGPSIRPADGGHPVRPDDTVLLVPELSDRLPTTTWGETARLVVRAAAIGYGLAATMRADRLEAIFEELRRPPVSLADDELSRLGLVLLLRRVKGDRRRVVAAHYVRPLARDEHGHVQRLGPAVLATWEPERDALEHFGWGVTPELAFRVARKAGDFELEVGRRRALLDGLVEAGRSSTGDVRAAIDVYRATSQTPVSSTVE